MFSTPMGSKRLPIVPVDSSAAKIPLPGAQIAFFEEVEADGGASRRRGEQGGREGEGWREFNGNYLRTRAYEEEDA